jgi:CHAD domain-containing protein
MSFDAERLLKPFHTLTKATKVSRKQLDPERVHKLRTTTRRVEAILGAVDIAEPRARKRLLRALKKIRRAAGTVRDMDVLTGKAADVSVAGERNCQVKLLQHLGAERQEKADALAHELKNRGKEIRRALKRCGKEIEPLVAADAASRQRAEEAHASARVLELSAELRRFAKLGRSNLHEFRKTGKQLRYVLQMALVKDEALLEGLREMQDAIGEWHDWDELVAIANEVLDDDHKCGLLRELQLHADDSFDHALRVSAAMRKRFLNSADKQRVPLRVVLASATLAA